MTYNPFETKRRNEMIARLEKERNTHREENKRLREELDSLRIERDVLRNACNYSEKIIAELQDSQSQWIKINSEADLPEGEGSYFVYSKTWYAPYFRVDIFTGRLTNTYQDGRFIFSHYIPIIKPQPPKED